jgi:hypothetical protein
MHEFRRARRELGDANDGALAGADIIVAFDKPARCAASASSEELSTGILSVDQISQPAM